MRTCLLRSGPCTHSRKHRKKDTYNTYANLLHCKRCEPYLHSVGTGMCACNRFEQLRYAKEKNKQPSGNHLRAAGGDETQRMLPQSMLHFTPPRPFALPSFISSRLSQWRHSCTHTHIHTHTHTHTHVVTSDWQHMRKVTQASENRRMEGDL